MNTIGRHPQGFRVGEWNVYPLAGEIKADGESVHLEPKVMQVLAMLAAGAGDVILREDLLCEVWGTRATVSDASLTRCVSQLRHALGDKPSRPTYVQTVPKRGYRLMRPVLPLAADAAGHGGRKISQVRFSWAAVASLAPIRQILRLGAVSAIVLAGSLFAFALAGL